MSGKVLPSLVLIVAIHGCHHHGCYVHARRIKRAFFPTTAADTPPLLLKAQEPAKFHDSLREEKHCRNLP